MRIDPRLSCLFWRKGRLPEFATQTLMFVLAVPKLKLTFTEVRMGDNLEELRRECAERIWCGRGDSNPKPCRASRRRDVG
jgi:hypothetical protein